MTRKVLREECCHGAARRLSGDEDMVGVSIGYWPLDLARSRSGRVEVKPTPLKSSMATDDIADLLSQLSLPSYSELAPEHNSPAYADESTLQRRPTPPPTGVAYVVFVGLETGVYPLWCVIALYFPSLTDSSLGRTARSRLRVFLTTPTSNIRASRQRRRRTSPRSPADWSAPRRNARPTSAVASSSASG